MLWWWWWWWWWRAAKSRDPELVVGPVRDALAYSRELAAGAGDEELLPGLGPVSLAGGPLAQEGRLREVKELYKVRGGGVLGTDAVVRSPLHV